LFIDPTRESVHRARDLGVPAIELHTGRYAQAWPRSKAALAELEEVAAYARTNGLAAHAGHGLTYRNVTAVAAVPEIEELNIGHSIVSRAIMVGMGQAVAEMRRLVDTARASI
jgi:pyridoxine 5-phosphate synthase